MDGLLIDSEPMWQEAGMETMSNYNVELTLDQYHTSTGLRTEEWIAHWFNYFSITADPQPAITTIVAKAIEKIYERGEAMPGVHHILEFFKSRGFRIGLATSSPQSLIDVVVQKLDIGNYFNAIASAESLPHGKPHPQVYLDCARSLHVSPLECVCFEDSFYGMIAAKAARMTCVVVPEHHVAGQSRWGAADLKLSSLAEFSDAELQRLSS
jgi:mannitol-1-/sugar-/sorbitol-6-/2-deoxyglucose-6-phosphatase